MKKWTFLSLFLFLVFSGMSQTKFEKEERIKETAVPKPALNFVNSLNFDGKIKWYKEIGLDTITIEAKTRFEGKKYSIEFKSDGTLEDVEVKMKWRGVPKETRKKIDELLFAKYVKYRLEKIQIQYAGTESNLRSFLREGITPQELTINYEMVIQTKLNGVYEKFEYLFSQDGEFISSAQIVLKNTDHIEY